MAASARGNTALIVLVVLLGLAALGGLGWWAMGGGARPVLVAPAPIAPGGGGAAAPADEDGLRALLRDPAVIARGKSIYGSLCFTCHGFYGEGGLGPNLRDDAWLSGSTMIDLVRTIADGRPGTAMQPMKHTYPASDIAAVAAFIVTLKGGTAGIDKGAEGRTAPITYWP